MADLLRYDNEKDMAALIDDIVEFILSETKRTVDQQEITDPNAIIQVSQHLTLELTSGLLLVMRVKQSKYIQEVERRRRQQQADQGVNHLPVNGRDFFKEQRRPPR